MAGPARAAVLGRLKLARPVGARLVLRAVSLQRGPGAAVALPARQRRTHDRGAASAEVLRRLRAAFPNAALTVLWEGAPYHRARAVREAATTLGITLMPLPGYSPDLM